MHGRDWFLLAQFHYLHVFQRALIYNAESSGKLDFPLNSNSSTTSIEILEVGTF